MAQSALGMPCNDWKQLGRLVNPGLRHPDMTITRGRRRTTYLKNQQVASVIFQIIELPYGTCIGKRLFYKERQGDNSPQKGGQYVDQTFEGGAL